MSGDTPSERLAADIVPPRDCYAGQEHVLSYNPYNFAIQCERCGKPFIIFLREIRPGVYVRDKNADPFKQ